MNISTEVSGLLDLKLVELSRLQQTIEIILFSFISLSLPIFLGHPQILVGSVINFLIVRSSLTTKNWKNLPVIFLPAIGAFSRGLLFGTFTQYLVMIIPFVWAGNYILSFLTRYFFQQNNNHLPFIPLILIAFLKTVIIFLPVLLLVRLQLLPQVFLKSMGLVQVTTAIIGLSIGVLSLRINRYFIKH